MKPFNSAVLALFGLLLLTTSCNKTKSYADYLKEEKRAIDLFIAENNISILRSFPAGGIFEENEFYKDPSTGVYFNIVEYGDTTAMPLWREKIFVRFRGLNYIKDDDTIRYSNFQIAFPEELEYVGPISTTTKSSYSTAGWVVPLSYVGHRGRVKMIIPFEMGSPQDQSQYEPTYYDQVVYRFESRW